jgi:hypothetical protein
MTDILQYKDYYATIHFSVEDEVFYGKIILPFQKNATVSIFPMKPNNCDE